jgi:hypothetical protein
MEKHEHLRLPLFQGNIERQKHGGGGFSLPAGRNKAYFSQRVNQQVKNLNKAFIRLKEDFSSGLIDPKLYEIVFFPGANTRKAGCHQKAWKLYQREPQNKPVSPVSLVLVNVNKWITDERRMQDYCISVVFEHEKAIKLYDAIRTNIQTRIRLR